MINRLSGKVNLATDKQNQTVVKFEEGLRLENHNSVMCTVAGLAIK